MTKSAVMLQRVFGVGDFFVSGLSHAHSVNGSWRKPGGLG